MAVDRCARFWLELEVDREPISGRLVGEAGFERHFAGVLDLLATLDQARSASQGSGRPDPHGRGSEASPSPP